MKTLIVELPRNFKRLILVGFDFLSLSLAVYISLSLRSDSFFFPSNGYELTGASADDVYIIIFLLPIISIPLFIISRLYRSVTRHIGNETYIKILKVTFISITAWSGIILFLEFPIPRSVLLITFILSLVATLLSRYVARSILQSKSHSSSYKNILLYGIDNEVIEIAEILKNYEKFKLNGFITELKESKGTVISDKPVYLLSDINSVISYKNIDEIFIVDNDNDKNSLRDKISKLKGLKIKIRKIPNLSQMSDRQFNPNHIKKVDIEDLLGRKTVDPDQYLIKACVENKVVLVTGCGGSIGSELSRQIMHLNPKKLLLVDHSEYLLYEIDHEIHQISKDCKYETKIVSHLNSITNKDFVETLFAKEEIDTIYHAAAYKHVPLVENNPLSAINTNILGTYCLASAAYRNNIENFVLISSDKAVRPTNIMGATKRFAELICQSFQDVVDNMPSNKSKTKFCMVRFGNVLDTSGSVIPLFRRQISIGGPVTVTHPDVIRYFMTIKEATELVIQAGALSKGGEIFILEMGEAMNVLELAKDMIRLSGKEIKNDSNIKGEIEIIFTGLRPGEKLYEELSIGNNILKTAHSHIMSAQEEKISPDEVEGLIKRFAELTNRSSHKDICDLLLDSTTGYSPTNIVEIETFRKK